MRLNPAHPPCGRSTPADQSERRTSPQNPHPANTSIPIVAVPKTIDNDLASTDRTFGFDTAVQIATEARPAAVMGRHAGWIATYSGSAGGADAILIPERPFDMAEVARHLKHRAGIGRTFSIVMVAEGAKPVEGTMEIPEPAKDQYERPRLGGVGQHIAAEIERRTGIETRITILGHVQRGGTPTAFDRVLATQASPPSISPQPGSGARWRNCTASK